MSLFPIFLLNYSIDDSYHLGFLSTRKNIFRYLIVHKKYELEKLLSQFIFSLKMILLDLRVPSSLIMVVKNQTTYLIKQLTKIFFPPFGEFFQNYWRSNNIESKKKQQFTRSI